MSSIFMDKTGEDPQYLSIVGHFAEIMRYVEEQFGERDRTFDLYGIEVKKNPTGESRPDEIVDMERKYIILQITPGAMVDINRAILQVSHMAIHCLNPTIDEYRNYLEEGVATYFSIEYCKSKYQIEWSLYQQNYIDAMNSVAELLSFDSEFIFKLRKLTPSLSLVTSEDILRVNSNVPDDLISRLMAKFHI